MWVGGWMNRWMIDGRVDEWISKWSVDGWKDGQIGGFDGWMDG